MSSLDHLAIIEEKSGNKEIARQLLNNAIQTATQAQMKEAKKHLKKRLSKI